MKTLFATTALLLLSLVARAQGEHKIVPAIYLNGGLNYFTGEIGNAYAGILSVGYEYKFIPFFGIEAGLNGAMFNQKVGYEALRNQKDVYSGLYGGFYVSPKFYLPVYTTDKFSRESALVFEPRLCYNHVGVEVDLVDKGPTNRSNWDVSYQLKLGFLFPVAESWNLVPWVGYSSFDFMRHSRVPNLKTATQFLLGLSFEYVFGK